MFLTMFSLRFDKLTPLLQMEQSDNVRINPSNGHFAVDASHAIMSITFIQDVQDKMVSFIKMGHY